jgi:hypothetical protein
MKLQRTPIAIAALVLGIAFSAQAQKPLPGEDTPPKPTPSTVERKDVKKQAVDQTKAGKQPVGECDAQQRADAGACKKEPVKATRTRADAKAEAAATNKAGQTAGGEMSGPQKKDEGAAKK